MDMIKFAFIQYRQLLVNYVNVRVRDIALAEDIVQDAFVRLLEMQVGLHANSVKGLLFTTCRHLMVDHLRRKRMWEHICDMYTHEGVAVESTAQTVRVHEIEECERCVLRAMPEKRRMVYGLSRFEGRSIAEISEQLHISPRTVEAHLFVSRKVVREQVRRAFAS